MLGACDAHVTHVQPREAVLGGFGCDVTSGAAESWCVALVLDVANECILGSTCLPLVSDCARNAHVTQAQARGAAVSAFHYALASGAGTALCVALVLGTSNVCFWRQSTSPSGAVIAHARRT